MNALFAPVTLILTYDLVVYILKMSIGCILKMKFVGQGFHKLEHERDRHTHRQMQQVYQRYQLHLRVVINRILL